MILVKWLGSLKTSSVILVSSASSKLHNKQYLIWILISTACYRSLGCVLFMELKNCLLNAIMDLVKFHCDRWSTTVWSLEHGGVRIKPACAFLLYMIALEETVHVRVRSSGIVFHGHEENIGFFLNSLSTGRTANIDFLPHRRHTRPH